MSYFLGIDLGTSYFKAGVFDEDGNLLGMGRRFVEKNSPNGDTCELLVAVFWNTLRFCVDEAINESGILPGNISAISYSSQANSFILLDKNDKPLTPFILWPDIRSDGSSVSLQAFINHEELLTKTGLGIRPGRQHLIGKLDWFQKNQPKTWDKVNRIMSISDYLIFSLTGEFVTDTSTSSMTGLLDVRESTWWKEATDLFRLKTECMPIPLKIGTFTGNLTRKGAEKIGLTIKTSLFTGGLDHHMVAVGAGGINSKNLSESTGTVLACVNYCNDFLPKEGINVARGADNHHFFQMSFDDNGAQALEWFREKYAGDSTITELINKAEAIKPGCNGLIALPKAYDYPGLEGFVKRTKQHGDGHFIRAILESTSFSLLQLVETLDVNHSSKIIIPSGGGAKSRLWIQIKANLLNRAFCIPDSVELACKGAAMLCAVGTSRFANLEEATEKQVNFKERIDPEPVEAEFYKKWCQNIKSI